MNWYVTQNHLCGGSSKPSSLQNQNSKRWKTTMNEDEFYLPEVRHGGKKWALRGNVSRVARVMVHLEEREQSVWAGTGGWNHTVWVKDSHQRLHLDWGMRAENICFWCLLSLHSLIPLLPLSPQDLTVFNGCHKTNLKYKENYALSLVNCEHNTVLC